MNQEIKTIKRYDPIRNKIAEDYYPDLSPNRFLKDFFHISDSKTYFKWLLGTLFSFYPNYDPKKIMNLLLESFHLTHREEFATNVWKYIFSTVQSNTDKLGHKRIKEYTPEEIGKGFTSSCSEYLCLFLRNRLIRQEEFETEDEDKLLGSAFYFPDICFHEFAVKRKFVFFLPITDIEQAPDEIYGQQNFALEVEGINSERYEFEVSKGNYRRFHKKIERDLNDRVSFGFEILEILEERRCLARITEYMG